jgi:uncharacterized protein
VSRKHASLLFIVTVAVLCSITSVSVPQDAGFATAFDYREVMVPMRDGIKLHTTVYSPKNRTESLPIMLTRTPYGITGAARSFAVGYKELADDGYIFAFQDIRGRYTSEGSFVMMRPVRDRKDSRSFDETTDAYDTVEWLCKNVPGNNGRVGMLGVSYPGWLTAMAMLEPHPALRAVSPQASPADMWLGDDFHHNGAFRLSYGFEYATRMETNREQAHFDFDRYDTYEWYLSLGPLSNVNSKYLLGNIPTWNDFVAHPDYDEFWQRQSLIPSLTNVHVPTLNVAGWWDQEDFYGPVKIYEMLEPRDKENRSFLVVGPWNHGGWNQPEGNSLGAIKFGGATSRYFREKIQAPWFAHYLKDRQMAPQPEAVTFEAGTNEWRSWDAWPPASRTAAKPVYLQSGGKLSFEAPPKGGDACGSYVSDPAHPVPYRHRPVEPTYFAAGSGWGAWQTEDQRFVDDRADVLSWEGETLGADLRIAGRIQANLFVSTTGSDADWIVKLIDVYPEKNPDDWKMAGYQLMVACEVFRGRYRKGFERPVPMVPGEVTPITIDLHTQSYAFRKGHRLMVQVQSTWFPLIDRNPQTFVPNIFNATPSDFHSATHRIHPLSHLTLPVVSGSDHDK